MAKAQAPSNADRGKPVRRRPTNSAPLCGSRRRVSGSKLELPTANSPVAVTRRLASGTNSRPNVTATPRRVTGS